MKAFINAGIDPNTVYIAGQDGSPEGLAAVKEGGMYRASSAIPMDALAASIVDAAMAAATGKGETNLVTPTVLAKADNPQLVADLIGNFERKANEMPRDVLDQEKSVTFGLMLSGIRKSYGANHVLRGIDMNIPAGTVHALLGANGAGKSTLLGCLSGATSPDDGEIVIGGGAPTVGSRRHKLLKLDAPSFTSIFSSSRRSPSRTIYFSAKSVGPSLGPSIPAGRSVKHKASSNLWTWT